MDTNKGERREVKVRKIQVRKRRLGDSAARGGGRLARRRSVARIVTPVTAVAALSP